MFTFWYLNLISCLSKRKIHSPTFKCAQRNQKCYPHRFSNTPCLLCQQPRTPQHWYELIKKLRQNCSLGESPSQGTHFIKSFLILLPLSGGAGSPLHINPCRGDTVADIWDGNQEIYFFGIECPLSSCNARIVGKSELLLLYFFGGVLFQFGFF